MANREFLMLAHSLGTRHCVGGWWWSEKLDGMRAYWDGGITRGLMKAQVPFANLKKDERYKKPPMATGLWSRYGNVIHAPDWWLDKLPKIPLDGELYVEEGYRQDIMSIVKDIEPSGEWVHVRNKVFDSPPPAVIYDDGKINNPNFSKRFAGVMQWYRNEVEEEFKPEWIAGSRTAFRSTYHRLYATLLNNEIAEAIPQMELPMATDAALEELRRQLDIITNRGGEGIIVRNPNLPYECIRSHHMLKMKKLQDMEGKVIGYTTGRETDKGSKLLGLMGALILRIDNNITLELSGFTDSERQLIGNDGTYCASADWAMEHPGEECPDWIEAVNFPRGSRVTFRYRGLSKDGVPQEARYWRRREDV